MTPGSMAGMTPGDLLVLALLALPVATAGVLALVPSHRIGATDQCRIAC
jgi:hypothetical protein